MTEFHESNVVDRKLIKKKHASIAYQVYCALTQTFPKEIDDYTQLIEPKIAFEFITYVFSVTSGIRIQSKLAEYTVYLSRNKLRHVLIEV
jgi:thermostable 8-oxoguanine DNA glycosylase